MFINGHLSFLLAFFHMEFLKDMTTPSDIFMALDELPRGADAFDETYRKTVNRIGCLVPKQRRVAKRVLEWLVCAARPFTLLELQHALATEAGQKPPTKYHLQMPQVIVRLCMGLIFVEEESGVVRLLHQTTREYFDHNISCLSGLEEPLSGGNRGASNRQNLTDYHQSIAIACVA